MLLPFRRANENLDFSQGFRALATLPLPTQVTLSPNETPAFSAYRGRASLTDPLVCMQVGKALLCSLAINHNNSPFNPNKMASPNRVIRNTKTGQNTRFMQTAGQTQEHLREIEATYPDRSPEPTPHYDLYQV